MADSVLLLHTGIAIAGIVVIITWLRVPPIIALLVGSIYFGLVTGLGLERTAAVVTKGFGELMTEIGLLITFGVLLGSMLTATDTMRRLTEAILRKVRPDGIPYTFSATLSTLFTSIYSDVLLVITAPLARRLAPKLGPKGIALMGGALTAGIEVGLVFVVPGVAAVAVAGLLRVPLGTMFLLGLVIALPTALLTMLAFSWLARRALRWQPDLDTVDTQHSTVEEPERERHGMPPLALSLAPVLLALLLISIDTIAQAAGWDSAVLGFLGDPIIAMFLGATAAYVIARCYLPSAKVGDAVSSALTTAGPILVLTGVSGSLAAVIGESALKDVLAGYFSVGFLPPLLLVWLVAAILHVALGSISVAAITATGILAPLAAGMGVDPVLIALAAGSGALFVPHVSSNFFWMFQTLLGLSTRGTFKTHSVAMTLSSVISLPLILALDLVV